MLKKLFILFFILVILIGCGVGSFLYWAVVVEPGPEIQPENIKTILSKESEVYYSDGVTKLGVFFDTAHRQYVEYRQIPHDFVNALVAAEDNRFFQHFGFDIFGIMRALVRNIQAGRVVQGGSTLTQQTAKNLFKRTDRSYQAKLKEALFALRLEHHYTKQDIFEFYANQFYVSGNGHGLGVAARYYFDKTPEELNLAECAFIAGSVNRPNAYNPFIKKNTEAAEKARQRAVARQRYVLDKMQELGMIDSFAYNQARGEGVRFNKGQVGFALDYVMEMVRDAVSSSEVVDALALHDINNIATSGVKIITTIDKELQDKTLTDLRSELSRLDVRLRGYNRDEVQQELQALEYSGDTSLVKGAFLFGTIESITGTGDAIEIGVELDKKRGHGLIDSRGLQELVRAQVKWEKNRWSEPEKGDQQKLVKQLKVGDRVWVSVRDLDEENQAKFDLEKYPQIQGGAMVMQYGKIKSMAGGTENRFFNRAVHARRTMGSSFKPLVYAAALQLGWNSGDLLKNSRDLFVFHGKPYFPRPDHNSPHEWVSMNWAGVHSENVASVWLLAHLCDQLSPIQFKDLAAHVDLAPRVVDGESEPYRRYAARIRDEYGILVNRDALRAAAYRVAIQSMEADFIFDNQLGQYKQLKDLPYGLNFDQFRQDLRSEEAAEKSISESERNEYYLRGKILKRSFLMYEKQVAYLAELRSSLAFADYNPYSLAGVQEQRAEKFFVDNGTGKFYYLSPNEAAPPLSPVDPLRLKTYLSHLDLDAQSRFWTELTLADNISVETVQRVTRQLETENEKLVNKLPYDFDVLAEIEDFRITVGLHYLIDLTRKLGVRSDLQPVLSYPLGSNVITLMEATRIYEGLVTGSVTTYGNSKDVFGEEEHEDSLAIIDRIESEDGVTLYEPQAVSAEVFDPKTRIAISSILENVVKFGTGRAADQTVRLAGIGGEKHEGDLENLDVTIPLLGKTGTANRYVNAAFLGYVPGTKNGTSALQLQDGFAVGVYVGFDDNDAMRRKSSRISGAAGALPTWCDIANTILREYHYGEHLDPVDLSFYGLKIDRENIGQLNLAVDADDGGKISDPAHLVNDTDRYTPSIITFGQMQENGRIKLTRSYQPFWKAQTAPEN